MSAREDRHLAGKKYMRYSMLDVTRRKSLRPNIVSNTDVGCVDKFNHLEDLLTKSAENRKFGLGSPFREGAFNLPASFPTMRVFGGMSTFRTRVFRCHRQIRPLKNGEHQSYRGA